MYLLAVKFLVVDYFFFFYSDIVIRAFVIYYLFISLHHGKHSNHLKLNQSPTNQLMFPVFDLNCVRLTAAVKQSKSDAC